VDETKLGNIGLNGLGKSVTLEGMIRDYGRHLGEVESLKKYKIRDCRLVRGKSKTGIISLSQLYMIKNADK